MGMRKLVSVLLAVCLVVFIVGASEDDKYKPKRMPKPKDDGKWKKKDIRDYSDADLERLYEQWEEDDEELPVDELPPWEKEPPPINMAKINLQDKDSLLKEGKRHRTLMMFATVAGPKDRKRTEEISGRWETSLFNNNIQLKRFVIEDDRILLQMDDGSNAVEIRDFLINQEDCYEVTVDNQTYDGKGKVSIDKMKPMSKEEAKEKKKKEAEKKAEKEKKKQDKQSATKKGGDTKKTDKKPKATKTEL